MLLTRRSGFVSRPRIAAMLALRRSLLIRSTLVARPLLNVVQAYAGLARLSLRLGRWASSAFYITEI